MRSFFSSAGDVSLDTEGRFEMEEIETDPSAIRRPVQGIIPSVFYLSNSQVTIYIHNFTSRCCIAIFANS
jgi:hypothetical protein